MRDKKIFLSVILITTIMLFTCGCGRQAEPVNAEPTETVEETDTEESTGKSTEENAKPTPSPAAALKESTGSSEVEDNSEREADATEEDEKPAQTEKPAATEKPVQNAQTKTEQQSTPAASESAQSEPAPAATPAPTPEPAPAATPAPIPVPTPEPQPVHEHVWKEHTATTQTWIPNIVVVEDYETQYVVVGGLAICGCGFETEDKNVIAQHIYDHLDAGDTQNFTVQDIYGEQQVLVGTHEEDQGHYETSTYVDYYYCDCGATR